MDDRPAPGDVCPASSCDGWWPLAATDMENVAAIASLLHPSLPERPDILAEKNRLFPQGCRKLLVNARFSGYALAHPWLLASPPGLDRYLESLPATTDCLFIHDVAVLPQARGQGAAAAYLQMMEVVASAHGLSALALIAVHGTARLWHRFGFAAADGLASGAPAAYGSEAVYLIRRLD